VDGQSTRSDWTGLTLERHKIVVHGQSNSVFDRNGQRFIYLFICLFIYYMVYTHVKSFTVVKNRKCGQVTSHCRKSRPYRADLSLFLNLPVVTVKSEITV